MDLLKTQLLLMIQKTPIGFRNRKTHKGKKLESKIGLGMTMNYYLQHFTFPIIGTLYEKKYVS